MFEIATPLQTERRTTRRSQTNLSLHTPQSSAITQSKAIDAVAKSTLKRAPKPLSTGPVSARGPAFKDTHSIGEATDSSPLPMAQEALVKAGLGIAAATRRASPKTTEASDIFTLAKEKSAPESAAPETLSESQIQALEAVREAAQPITQGEEKLDIFSRIMRTMFTIRRQIGGELEKLCGDLEKRTQTIDKALKLNGILISAGKGPIHFKDHAEMRDLVDYLRGEGAALPDVPAKPSKKEFVTEEETEENVSWSEEEVERVKLQLHNFKDRIERLSQEVQMKLQQHTTEHNLSFETLSNLLKHLYQALEVLINNIG